MSVPLLTTKFLFPPARHSLVSRPRLLERLTIGLRGPLTLLPAPAGYGKATLLGEWRSGMGRDPSTAKLSLDGGDGDPILFLGYLTAALESLRAGLMGSTLGLLQPPRPPLLESILISLVNDLATCPEDFILVSDDFHVITSPTIHDMIAFLLAHAPPCMHLAILTREDPPLPLRKPNSMPAAVTRRSNGAQMRMN
jgi:LuxR family maltose regulon positive regulatory protein